MGIVFEENFSGKSLDKNKWNETGGIRGSRGLLKPNLGRRYGSGRVDVIDSILVQHLYSKFRDHIIRMMACGLDSEFLKTA